MRKKKKINEFDQEPVQISVLTEEEIERLNEQNEALLKEIDEGSTSAMAQLLINNGKYIESIAAEYAAKLNSSTYVDAEDVRAEAFCNVFELLKSNDFILDKQDFAGDIKKLLDITLSSYVANVNSNDEVHLNDCVAPGKPKLGEVITTGRSTLDDIIIEGEFEQLEEEAKNNIHK